MIMNDDVYDAIEPLNDSTIKAIYQTNKKLFDLAMKLSKLAHSVIPIGFKLEENTLNPTVEKTLVALYTQSYRLYRSIIILCKSGLGIESLIMLRSLQETGTYLLYIAEKDHDVRLEHYWYSTILSQHGRAKEYLEYFPDDKVKINFALFEKEKEEALQYFRKKHGKNVSESDIKKKYTLKTVNIVQDLYEPKMVKNYKIIFRDASSVAHGENIRKYIKPNNTNLNTFYLTVSPTDNYVILSITHSMMYIFHEMKRIDELLKIIDSKLNNDLEAEILELLKKLGRDVPL